MIVFLHIPKTAGTTFDFVLANSFGLRHCHMGYNCRPLVRQEDLDFARRLFPGLRSVSGNNLVNPLGLRAPNAFYMTFLREPLARVFSHYQDDVVRCRKTLSFEQMLLSDDVLENLQVKLIAGERNLDKAKRCLERLNFLGLTEKFDLSLAALQRLCPYRVNPSYVRRLTARANTVRKALESDPRLVEMTRDRNRLDLELYEFATREIFPRICSRAGLDPSDQVPSFEKYSTEIRLNYVLHRAYNKLFFREICKRRNRKYPPEPANAQPGDRFVKA